MKNLDYVVSLVQMDLQDYSSNSYQRLLQYSIMGYRELHWLVMPGVKVAYLMPNDALVADLPPDFEYYTKIGVNIGGQVWTLTVNNDMVLSRRTDGCGDEVVENGTPELTAIENQDGTSFWYFAPHFRNGQFVGEMYGLGGGFNELGYFKIDETKNRIQFQSVVPKNEIILEYKSNGAENSGATVLPTTAVAAVRAYIHWQLAEFDRTFAPSEKERRRQLYFNEFEKVKFIQFVFTKDEYLDECYANIHMTVKR